MSALQKCMVEIATPNGTNIQIFRVWPMDYVGALAPTAPGKSAPLLQLMGLHLLRLRPVKRCQLGNRAISHRNIVTLTGVSHPL